MATLCVLVDMPVEVVTPRVFCFQTIANYYKKWQIFETFLFKIRITTYKQQGQMSERHGEVDSNLPYILILE